MWAAVWGHVACVRLLLEAGADKEAKCNVRSALPRQTRFAYNSECFVCGCEDSVNLANECILISLHFSFFHTVDVCFTFVFLEFRLELSSRMRSLFVLFIFVAIIIYFCVALKQNGQTALDYAKEFSQNEIVRLLGGGVCLCC